jgi:hypothetical protein
MIVILCKHNRDVKGDHAKGDGRRIYIKEDRRSWKSDDRQNKDTYMQPV